MNTCTHAGTSRRRGFSVVELVISLTVLGVVLSALLGLVVGAQRAYTFQREAVRAQESLRVAQHAIATVLRAAGADPASSGSTQLDPDPLNHGTFDNVRVVSDFNPADKDVLDALEDMVIYTAADTLFIRWQALATAQAVAYPVRSLLFTYYDVDGTQLTTSSTIATDATKVRVQMVAPGDRKSSGTVEGSESWVYLRNRG